MELIATDYGYDAVITTGVDMSDADSVTVNLVSPSGVDLAPKDLSTGAITDPGVGEVRIPISANELVETGWWAGQVHKIRSGSRQSSAAFFFEVTGTLP